ncbi:hypothetical protein JCM3775_006997 [Rhodotorula graminis]
MPDPLSRSPSPDPASSRDHAVADNHDDQGHRRREVVVLSPRESPTPPLDHEAAAAAAAAPTLRVVAASPPPPPQHDALPSDGDQPRSLLRQLASAATGVGPLASPDQAADPSHLAPDLYYDAAGRLRTTTGTSRVRQAAMSGGDTVPRPPDEDRFAADTDDDEDDQALLVSSLRAGDTSRSRRRTYRGRSILAAAADDSAARDAGGDEVFGDTGWVQLGLAPAAHPEVSPEELRAAREAWIDAGAAGAPVPFWPSPKAARAGQDGGVRAGARRDEDRSGRSSTELDIEALHAEREAAQRRLEQSERNFVAATAQLAAHRQLGERMDSAFGSSLWRNQPQSVARSGALPRGGLLFRPLPTTFSPANPPAHAFALDAESDSGSSTSTSDDYAAWLESVGARAPISVDAGDDEPRQRRLVRPPRAIVVDSSDDDSDRDDGDREWEQLEAEAMAASRAADRRGAAARRDGDGAPALIGRRRPVVRPPPSSSPPPQDDAPVGPGALPRQSPRRRTREETNAMMGAALRSKKPVELLYCGGPAVEGLPAGFSWADDGAAASASTSSTASTSASTSSTSAALKGKGRARAEGCGALVCARALLEGVPGKVFEDQGREEAAASSDLPPCADKVADFGGEEDGLGGGERIGERGWRGCKGCVTRDVGCKRCGNHLGYRLLRPCVPCSLSRPTYTSYASAVTSRYPPQPLVLSAGGVTGGGVVDGLMFHYRLEAVTPLARLVGRTPADELGVEERVRSRSGEGGESGGGEEVNGDSQERASGGGWAAGRPEAPEPRRRLRERPPRAGERMRWKAIPSAQRDFQDGLVGEPSDWIDPQGETWWLDNAIAMHARKRTASGAFGEGGNAGVLNTDRLSSASTTVNGATTGAVASPSSSSPSGSTLSRSHAIRTRIPLSRAINSNAPLFGSSARDSSTTSYDRYRSDATAFSRRVRRRLADPSAAGGAVVGSLERAGYGSGFELEGEDGREGEQQRVERERGPRGGSAWTSGRERRREVVGR